MCEYEKPKVSSIIDSMINHVRAIQVEEHKLQRFHPYDHNTIRINHSFFNLVANVADSIHTLDNANQEYKRKEEKNG